MKKNFVLLLLVILMPSAIAAPALTNHARADKQTPPYPRPLLARLQNRIHAKLQEMHAAADFPGLTAGYVLADGRVLSVAAGYADKKIGLRPKDRMLSGSIGKTYVAAVALQLVSENSLVLDEKISHWLGTETWFKRLPNARDITVRMLMNHSSGIPEHVLMPEFLNAVRISPGRVWKPVELLAYVFDKAPLFAAGQDWSYADTNYIVLGMILEKITGNSYYRELDRRILKPLQLLETSPSDRSVLTGLITGHSSPRSPFALPEKVVVRGAMVSIQIAD
jgi:D-alanyl-D-alanine carboxypeptidase